MKLGDFRIHYLNGGITHIDGGAMFGVVPKAFIDTGIGSGKLTDKERRNFGAHYESQISEDLKALDLTTADIDYVLMTHLHFDHAAGLTDNEGNSIFNKAIHVIQQDEWHEFQSPNIRSKSTYWPKNNGDFKNDYYCLKMKSK